MDISKDSLILEEELQVNLHKACIREEEFWRLKSRSLWLQVGDKNTSFFHKQTQARRNFNSIVEITSGDQSFSDFVSIKKVAHRHFKELYTEDKQASLSSNLLELVPLKVNAQMNAMLNAHVTVNEIKQALDEMDPDKAPGPDGFTARFIKNCWNIVKKDLLKMILKSQTCHKLGGSTNLAFLALIPKEKGANYFNRFRPISLCNIGYKLITKVMENKLKGLLLEIIPDNQGGFVQR